ncbi:hypothetical protein R1sor_009708 [Riccia sorocarpa]|uniref:Uncharacterized protein n=1 Tax=Riccia sorocarpa TaxID=122646 RepID=A0ABD3HYM7_9MARC
MQTTGEKDLQDKTLKAEIKNNRFEVIGADPEAEEDSEDWWEQEDDAQNQGVEMKPEDSHEKSVEEEEPHQSAKGKPNAEEGEKSKEEDQFTTFDEAEKLNTRMTSEL